MAYFESRPQIGPHGYGIDMAPVVHRAEQKILQGLEAPRRLAADVVEATSDYIQAQGIQNLLVVDRAARPGGTALSRHWRQTHPGVPRPFNIYFVNPRGFVTPEEFTGIYYYGINRRQTELYLSQYKGDVYDETATGRPVEEINSDLEKSFPALMSNRTAPTMLFDTCLHTGRSMQSTITRLREGGFTDLRIGVAGDSSNTSGIVPDFIALPGYGEQTCNIFAGDDVVEKPFDRVVSKRTEDPALYQNGVATREALGLVDRRAASEPMVAVTSAGNLAFRLPAGFELSQEFVAEVAQEVAAEVRAQQWRRIASQVPSWLSGWGERGRKNP